MKKILSILVAGAIGFTIGTTNVGRNYFDRAVDSAQRYIANSKTWNGVEKRYVEFVENLSHPKKEKVGGRG